MSITAEGTVLVHDVEVGASKVLHFLTAAPAKVATAEPKVLAALGTLATGASKAVSDVATAAANPAAMVNIAFDSQTFADLKAAWPDLKAFLATLGIKV